MGKWPASIAAGALIVIAACSTSERFGTRYEYNSAGRLVQETQLAKDNSVRSKIVYDYDAAGRPIGYATYDGEGKLLGRTSPKKPAAEATGTPSKKSR